MTVDKNTFRSLLHRYASSSPQDVDAIVALKAQYPYSQLLATLAAKFVNDNQRPAWQHELQAAAIRSADRTVLKEVMDNEIEFTTIGAETFTEATPVKKELQTDTLVNGPVAEKTDVPQQEKKIVIYEADVALTHFEGTDVADQVMKDLEKLNVSRHNFEMLFVEYAEVNDYKKEDTENSMKPAETAGSPDSVREKESHKSRKQRIVELAKARTAAPSPAVETIEETKKKRNSETKASPNDELIKEIITSKEEISPESPKQKEQIDIIDHFIQKQPSITSARDKQPAPITDLNPIRTGEFGDNIISETLVEILIKQGKKDKAVEVLKKLIWKYPQKKAYFASQIEELKK
ncbi:MAG TPA: hypothetical protein VGD40_03655 [Chryseosolibacter sp.]